MSLARTVSILAAALAVLVALPAGAQTLSLVGTTAKVCQLTGQTDWRTGAPTDAQTLTNYNLKGIDLGFPVEGDAGKLYLLFGDANPDGHPPNSFPSVPPDDAVGYTTRTAAPDAKTCLDLKFIGTPRGVGHPVVSPPIQQGSYNVPTGGVFVNDRIYAFFWTSHCTFADAYGPNDVTPLVLPLQSAKCLEQPVSNSLGRSVLAWATPANPLKFTQIALPADIAFVPEAMPNGFVYVTATEPLPRRIGVDYKPGYQAPIAVFGVPRYRMSIPYVALAPQATFGDPKTWSYYAGTNASGPKWISFAQWQAGHVGAQWSPPAGAEVYANSPNAYSFSKDERCVGEHQVSWNATLHVWLMLYTCGGWQVEARTAPEPWGPWSKPTMLLSAVTEPGLFCNLFWNKTIGLHTCGPTLVSQQPAAFSFGYFYAPFVLNRYTEDKTPKGSTTREARIYWLLSTWDPYQVMVMQSTVKVGP
jgi:hypothetical protein